MRKWTRHCFRLSDNEKANILFDLINPNFNEEGNWELNGFITDVYDDYALYVNNTGYHRVYYTKDGDNITLGEIIDVKITDVTASEYSALEAMKAISGTYEAAQEAYTTLKGKASELEEEKTAFEAEKETLTTEKTELEGKVAGFEGEKTAIFSS